MAETQTVTSKDGTPIAYEKVGSGPELVLVDGALCYRDFGPSRSLANHLADRFTVYFYDRRGRGGSGDTQPYAVEREYEDLEAVIIAAGGNPFVAGFSSGGALALHAAASGVGMRRIASYEAPYVGLHKVKRQELDYHGQLRQLIAKGDRAGAVAFFMVKMVGAPPFVPLLMRLSPKVWKQLTGVAHTLPYDAAVMGNFEVPRDTLQKITVPTLIMGGGKSKANMAAAVKNTADAIPDSRHESLAGQTHQAKDDVIGPALTEFFASDAEVR
ncbi:alpha/beta fold hydrolase [Arthrobacter sp. M4]|uniref:alpha/beta fold hydrolase n=1 Tax=Arthrobacter sp. M4 TaxID=218160 RepID=UPI001CDBE014|nr:alpha/beta hydrolase [Arthrobacter sp. M4]MCA4135357.1 alpha/beta hydrolase [Arthrobacter sp. M4]